MKKYISNIILFSLATTFIIKVHAQPNKKYDAEVEARIKQVEENLGTWVQIGEKLKWTLNDRLKFYHVNGKKPLVQLRELTIFNCPLSSVLGETRSGLVLLTALTSFNIREVCCSASFKIIDVLIFCVHDRSVEPHSNKIKMVFSFMLLPYY